MVEMNLFALIGSAVVLFLIGALVFLGLGFIFKSLKKLFWIIGFLLLVVGGYFLFYG